MKRLQKVLSENELIEIHELDNLSELIQLFAVTAPALVFGCDPRKTIKFLATCRKKIKQTGSKTVLVRKNELPAKALKKFQQLGISEIIYEPIPPKTLVYKANFLIRSLPVKKEDSKKKSLLEKKAEEAKKNQQDEEQDEFEASFNKKADQIEEDENFVGELQKKKDGSEADEDLYGRKKKKNLDHMNPDDLYDDVLKGKIEEGSDIYERDGMDFEKKLEDDESIDPNFNDYSDEEIETQEFSLNDLLKGKKTEEESNDPDDFVEKKRPKVNFDDQEDLYDTDKKTDSEGPGIDLDLGSDTPKETEQDDFNNLELKQYSKAQTPAQVEDFVDEFDHDKGSMDKKDFGDDFDEPESGWHDCTDEDDFAPEKPEFNDRQDEINLGGLGKNKEEELDYGQELPHDEDGTPNVEDVFDSDFSLAGLKAKKDKTSSSEDDENNEENEEAQDIDFDSSLLDKLKKGSESEDEEGAYSRKKKTYEEGEDWQKEKKNNQGVDEEEFESAYDVDFDMGDLKGKKSNDQHENSDNPDQDSGQDIDFDSNLLDSLKKKDEDSEVAAGKSIDLDDPLNETSLGHSEDAQGAEGQRDIDYEGPVNKERNKQQNGEDGHFPDASHEEPEDIDFDSDLLSKLKKDPEDEQKSAKREKRIDEVDDNWDFDRDDPNAGRSSKESNEERGESVHDVDFSLDKMERELDASKAQTETKREQSGFEHDYSEEEKKKKNAYSEESSGEDNERGEDEIKERERRESGYSEEDGGIPEYDTSIDDDEEDDDESRKRKDNDDPRDLELPNLKKDEDSAASKKDRESEDERGVDPFDVEFNKNKQEGTNSEDSENEKNKDAHDDPFDVELPNLKKKKDPDADQAHAEDSENSDEDEEFNPEEPQFSDEDDEDDEEDDKDKENRDDPFDSDFSLDKDKKQGVDRDDDDDPNKKNSGGGYNPHSENNEQDEESLDKDKKDKKSGSGYGSEAEDEKNRAGRNLEDDDGHGKGGVYDEEDEERKKKGSQKIGTDRKAGATEAELGEEDADSSKKSAGELSSEDSKNKKNGEADPEAAQKKTQDEQELDMSIADKEKYGEGKERDPFEEDLAALKKRARAKENAKHTFPPDTKGLETVYKIVANYQNDSNTQTPDSVDLSKTLREEFGSVMSIYEYSTKGIKKIFDGHSTYSNEIGFDKGFGDWQNLEKSNLDKWNKYTSPTWQDRSFKSEYNELIFPFYDGKDYLGVAVVHTHHPFDDEQDALRLETFIEAMRFKVLENNMRAKKGSKKEDPSSKVKGMFKKVFGWRKSG